MLALNQIYHMDCMEGMKDFPDKYFELAIVDPPYGIGASTKTFLRQGKQTGKSQAISGLKYKAKQWDSIIPNVEYFKELKRISNDQIIWGGNYFNVSPSSCWIIWNKENGENLYADCELAWTSFDSAVRIVKQKWHGMLQKDMKHKETRIHPTQKPVALYKWLLKNYAKPGDKILDTHGGSFSSVIACLDMGFEYIAFEIDEEYFNNGLKRIETYKRQPKIFTPEQIAPEQIKIF